MKSGPHLPQLDKALAQKRRPNTAINKQTNKIKKKKTTRRYYFIPSLQVINIGEGMEKKEPSYTVGGNVNWYSHYGEQYRSSLKN